jgi:hypothetical protein
MHTRANHSPEELSELLERPTLTLPEVAAVYGVGSSTFRAGLRSGAINLPVITVGTRKVIPTAAIRRALGIGADS